METVHVSLEAILAAAMARLSGGAADPRGRWRNLTLATSDDGKPGIRTIVLRRFVPAARVAELHTDARSPKMAVIGRNPLASLIGWNEEDRVQLRLDGEITVADEASTQAAWDALPAGSRGTYAVSQPPGTPTSDPAGVRLDMPDDKARAAFRLLRFRFDALEYLSLEHGRHRRALFRWPDGALAATWLVP